ncbi:hypothetical protein BpHYR1_037430 [Brachionus plicatilis]|uniref:Uncharacterized protein n=1 Tax=Brachionus plicatilis TaxID=10195 RepID=A0A3M7PIT9_BRAPC|nr:hypothetical protein BpHYR1_037430 [Brachionus plicatilis]
MKTSLNNALKDKRVVPIVTQVRTKEWLYLFLQVLFKDNITPNIHALVSHLHQFQNLKIYKQSQFFYFYVIKAFFALSLLPAFFFGSIADCNALELWLILDLLLLILNDSNDNFLDRTNNYIY